MHASLSWCRERESEKDEKAIESRTFMRSVTLAVGVPPAGKTAETLEHFRNNVERQLLQVVLAAI